MSRFARNKETGEVILYDSSVGDWRPASMQEQIVAAQGLSGQLEAAVEGATGAQSIAGLFSPQIAERAQALSGPVGDTANMAGMAATIGAAGMPMAGRVAGRILARRQATDAVQGGGVKTSQGFIRQPEEALPEVAQGAGRIIRSGAETLPVTRVVTDFLIKNPNQKNLNRLFMRGIGATDDQIKAAGGKVTDDLVAAADANVSAQFNEVGKRISAKLQPDQVNKVAVDLANDNIISNARLAQIAEKTDDAGRSIMDLRSDVLAAQRQEMDRAVKVQLQNRIDEIDEIIASVVDDDVTRKLYSDARARYKLSLSLEKGQVWSNEAINPKSLDTALRRIYGKGYRRSADYSGLPSDVANALRGAREAQGVSVGVPSSGTAERMFATSLLGGTIGVQAN